MKTKKQKSTSNSKIRVEITEEQIWNEEKSKLLREHILAESAKQSPERKLRNEMLAIKFQMQRYVEGNQIEREMRIIDFVKLYLKILKISQKQFANIFEMQDSNLYKYLTGERKLNPDLVMKLSSFSHTEPETWYYIETKNELHELGKEKEKMKKYEKFDYMNFVPAR